MAKDRTDAPAFPIPPRQENLRTAQQMALAALSNQTDEQRHWLGAACVGGQWHLPVLESVLVTDPVSGAVCRVDGKAAHPTWQILVLHYLAIRTRPEALPPQVTFASLPGARVYASVYQNRVNRRLCAGVGRELRLLQTAATVLGAEPIPGGDGAFAVNIFPRVPLQLLWYAGEEDLPPDCTLLLPANIEAFFCIEDIVVLSESFVARLSGRAF